MRVEFKKVVSAYSLRAFFITKFASFQRIRSERLKLAVRLPKSIAPVRPRFRLVSKASDISLKEILSRDAAGEILERFCKDQNFLKQTDDEGNTMLHLVIKLNARRCARLICTLNACDEPWLSRNSHGETPIQMNEQSEIADDLRILTSNSPIERESKFWMSDLNEELIEERLRDSNSTKEILVALDGGGIKGAAEIMALRELSLRLSSTSPSITSLFKSFDWIGGTSVGAVIAAFSAPRHHENGSQSPDTNLGSFLAETRATFHPKLKKPSFRGELLHKSLREHVGTSRLGDIEAKNFPIEVQTDEDHREVEIVDALMASTASPLLLPVSPLGLSDGGVLAKNPSLVLLTEYHRFYAKAVRHPTPSLFLSLGTGYNEARRTSGIHFGDLPKNRVFFDWHFMRTTKNLFDVFVSQSTSGDTACLDQAAAWCLATRSPYFRINPPNINRLSLTCTDAEKVADFLWGVMVYLRTTARHDLDQLASFIKRLKS
ncbi:unnamed protein product, partial [Mesorhabditis belari]|uniref:PNPLA domain-containing protein n=1 Tax=Mesorhabditis belari TaxID=2138241 RepID=A0AAF3F7U3_9BILA